MVLVVTLEYTIQLIHYEVKVLLKFATDNSVYNTFNKVYYFY